MERWTWLLDKGESNWYMNKKRKKKGKVRIRGLKYPWMMYREKREEKS